MTNITKPIGKRNRLVSKQEAKAMLERIEVVEEKKVIYNPNEHETEKELSEIPYEIISSNNYNDAMDDLRLCYKTHAFSNEQKLYPTDDGDVIRPLTYRETMEILVNNYESGYKDKELSERVEFMQPENLYTCTGVVFKKDTDFFRIIPECKELILIEDNLENELDACYKDFSRLGYELYRPHLICNKVLSKEQALEHTGWLALFEFDRSLLGAYVDIVFSIQEELWTEKPVKAMMFMPTDQKTKDCIRTVTQLPKCFGIAVGAYLMRDPTNFMVLK